MFDLNHPTFIPLRDVHHFDEILNGPRALIFKHSPACGSSAFVHDLVADFAKKNPGRAMYIVDVIGQRPLSQHIAERLDVRHQSPQALVIEHGHVVWTKSHYAITHTALAEHLS